MLELSGACAAGRQSGVRSDGLVPAVLCTVGPPGRNQAMTTSLLLIDDDARLTTMVGDYLRRNGFEVDTAGSLAAGRERLRRAATTRCCST